MQDEATQIDWVEQGRAHAELGHHREAIAAYAAAIASQPASALVFNSRGESLTAIGAHEDGIADYSEAIRLDPTCAVARHNRARSLTETGRLDAAIDEYAELLRLQPDDAQAHAEVAWAFGIQGRREEELSAYFAAIQLDPQNPVTRGSRGVCLEEYGRFVEAIEDYTAAIELGPEDPSAYVRRAGGLKQIGRYTDAMNDFSVAIRLQPNDFRALVNRSQLHLVLGSHEDAIADAASAIGIDPERFEPYCNRGAARKALGRYEQAIEDFDHAIRLAPKSTIPHRGRGLCLAQIGRHEEAITDFRRAVQLDPEDAEAHLVLGDSLTALGRTVEGIAAHTESLRLRPLDPIALNNRGCAFSNLSRDEEAVADYSAALEIKPDYGDALGNRATVLRNLGRYDEAVADYTSALRVMPDYEHYWWRGWMRAQLGRHEEAIVDYQSALEMRPSDATAQYNLVNHLGWEFGLLGRTTEAIAAYTKAIHLVPLDVAGKDNAYVNRAELRERIGDFEEAAQDYLRILELAPEHEFVEEFRRAHERCAARKSPSQTESREIRARAVESTPEPATLGRPDYLLRLSALDETAAATYADLFVLPLPSTPPRKPGEYDDGHAFPDATLALFAAEPRKAREIARLLGMHNWTPADEEQFAWRTDSSLTVEAVLLAAAAHGVTIERELVPPKAKQQAARLEASSLSIVAAGASPSQTVWFGVDGHLELSGDRISLLELVRASRAGKRFVTFQNGGWGEIGDDLAAILERLATWLEPDEADHQGIRIPRLAGLSILAADSNALGSCDWGGLADAIRFAHAEPVEPFEAHGRLKLSPYQRVGHEWLVRLSRWAPGACLADDMGLGKTRQVLALLISRNTGPALVIAPASVCQTWLTFDGVVLLRDVLSSYAFDGSRAGNHRPAAGEVVVASYDYAVRHFDELARTRWSTLVFDEGHALKNSLAARTLQLARLTAGFRVVVTGTPLENNLSELWSISQFFAPGLFGALGEFEQRFRRPIEAGDDGRARVLVELLAPFVQRRLMDELAGGLQLPGLTEVEHRVELTPAERTHYEARRLLAHRTVKTALANVTEARKRIQAIDLLRQLRAIAVGIDRPATMTTSGAKIAELVKLATADKARGERILVFSQWTTALELVGQAFAERGITFEQFDGSLHTRQRTELQKRFQSGELDALLLTLGAGGVGINLWAASRVYLLDPWWNPHKEKQAICRAFRRGQTRPVVAVRLIAEGTVEVQVVELQRRKEALFDRVIRGSTGRTQMTTDELVSLLSDRC